MPPDALELLVPSFGSSVRMKSTADDVFVAALTDKKNQGGYHITGPVDESSRSIQRTRSEQGYIIADITNVYKP